MTVTVVCDVLAAESNGTTVAAMNLIRHLREHGHAVRVLCADKNRTGEDNTFVVPNPDLGKLAQAFVEKVGVNLAKPDEDIILKAVAGADLVHIMTPLPLGIAATKIARELNLPLTAGFHMQAENFTAYIKLNRLKPINKLVYKFMYDKVYKYADAIHYPTDFVRAEFEKAIKKKTRGQVISNGVNAAFHRCAVPKPESYRDKTVILSVGRYSAEKSQDTLLKAIRYSAYKNVIQLILAGQGAKAKAYKKLAAALPVPPVFALFSREEMPDIINYSDLYVHPAIIELEGISCLEAIACGKLTIVSDSELSATKGFAADDKCIFKSKNPKDLARVIDYWIEHPMEKAECENKYLQSSSKIDQTACMEQMLNFFEAVIQNKRCNS